LPAIGCEAVVKNTELTIAGKSFRLYRGQARSYISALRVGLSCDKLPHPSIYRGAACDKKPHASIYKKRCGFFGSAAVVIAQGGSDSCKGRSMLSS
jgi:hypothetical protein